MFVVSVFRKWLESLGSRAGKITRRRRRKGFAQLAAGENLEPRILLSAQMLLTTGPSGSVIAGQPLPSINGKVLPDAVYQQYGSLGGAAPAYQTLYQTLNANIVSNNYVDGLTADYFYLGTDAVPSIAAAQGLANHQGYAAIPNFSFYSTLFNKGTVYTGHDGGVVYESPFTPGFGIDDKSPPFLQGDSSSVSLFDQSQPNFVSTNNTPLPFNHVLLSSYIDMKGFFDVSTAQAGTAQFTVTSDDSSMLFIDGIPVVNNDGIHGTTAVTSSVVLTPGTHTIELQYDNSTFYGGAGGAYLSASGTFANQQPVLPYTPATSGGVSTGSTTSVQSTNNLSTTLDNLTLTKAGIYRLKLTGQDAYYYIFSNTANESISPVTTASFFVLPAAPKIISHPPVINGVLNVTAGQAFSWTVHLEDQYGNIANSNDPISVSLTGSPASGSVAPTGFVTGNSTVYAANGVATFNNLDIVAAGSYTMTFTDTLTGSTVQTWSTNVNVQPATPSQLIPVDTGDHTAGITAGTNFSVSVNIADSYGNIVTSNQSAVWLTDDNGLLISPAVKGVAQFNNLSLAAAGTHVLAFVDPVDRLANQLTVQINPGVTTQLVVGSSLTTVAGQTLPAVTVTAEDAYGNISPALNTPLMMTAATDIGTSTYTPDSTTIVPMTNGVAVFNNLKLTTPGSFRLVPSIAASYQPTSNALEQQLQLQRHLVQLGISTYQTVSGALTVVPGVPQQIQVAQPSPSTATAGQALPSMQVQLLDEYDNPATTGSSQVTVTVTGPRGFLASSTTAATSVNGVATFSNLLLGAAGSYTLNFSTPGVTPITTAPIVVSPAAAEQLVFPNPIASVGAGVSNGGIQVAVEDAYGNLVTNAGNTLTITASGPDNLTTRSVTANAYNGIATFNGLILTVAGSYTLTATDSANILTPGTSASFKVSPGLATSLAVVQKPVAAVSGQALSPALQISTVDQYGNPTTTSNLNAGGSVSVKLAGGRFTSNSTLTVPIVNGVATFANLVPNSPGDYALTGSIISTTSGAAIAFPQATTSLTVAPGAATQVSLTKTTSTVIAGQPASFQVTLRDLDNDVATTSPSPVTVTATGPGGFLGSSTTTVTADHGVATFSNLLFGTAGTYILSFSTGSLAPARAQILVTPAKISSLTMPSIDQDKFTAGSTLKTSGSVGLINTSVGVAVVATDAYGNKVTSSNASLTLSLNGAGSLASGVTTAKLQAGSAIFSGLTITTAGSYTLTITDAADGIVVSSNSFNILPGPVSKLVVTKAPVTAVAGQLLTSIQVTAQDKYSNVSTSGLLPIPTFSVSVTNPNAFDSGSTLTAVAQNGVATFANLTLNQSGISLITNPTGNSTITVKGQIQTTPVQTLTTSFPVNVTPATPDHFEIVKAPAPTTAGSALSSLQVRVLDRFNNLETGSTAPIYVSISDPSKTFATGSQTSVLLNNGVATFSNLSLNTAGAYSLVISADGARPVTTPSFTISAASASQLAFTQLPGVTTTQQAFDAGSTAYSVTLGDVNGDGKLDLLLANEFSFSASVLLGNGDGTFQARQTFATGSSPYSVTLGDLNGDGKPDLILVSPGNDNDVIVLLGNGDGTFQPQRTFATGLAPRSAAVSDVNGDGKMDLVVANSNSDTMSVLLGNGDGTFQTQQTFATNSSRPRSVVVSDVNGDGSKDLVVASAGSDSVTVLLGNGNGTFQEAQNYGTGPRPRSVAVSDVNKDGKLDLVTANFDNNTVSVLLGNGNGTFAPSQFFATGSSPNFVKIGDVNGDGLPDLVVANSGSSSVSVLIGNGNGTFQSQTIFATGSNPYSVDVGDVNGDGKMDLVAPNTRSNTVSVLLNGVSPLGTLQGPYLQAAVEDRFGNIVTTSTGKVTVSAAGPQGFSATSVTTVAASNGLATFTNLQLLAAGTYALTVTDTVDNLSPATALITVGGMQPAEAFVVKGGEYTPIAIGTISSVNGPSATGQQNGGANAGQITGGGTLGNGTLGNGTLGNGTLGNGTLGNGTQQNNGVNLLNGGLFTSPGTTSPNAVLANGVPVPAGVGVTGLSTLQNGGKFTAAGITFTAQNVRVVFQAASNEYDISGTVLATVGGGTVNLTLGTSNAPGLVVVGGTVTRLNATVSSAFLGGVTFSSIINQQSLGLTYSANSNGDQIVTIAGNGTLTSGLLSLNVNLGNGSGIVITNGTLTSINGTVSTTSFSLGAATFSPSTLQLAYSHNLLDQSITISGTAMMSLAGQNLNVQMDGQSTGIVIHNGIVGFSASVDTTSTINLLNGVKINPLSLRVVFDSAGIFALTGTATLKSATVSADISLGDSGTTGLIFKNGVLTSITAAVTSTSLNLPGATITPSTLSLVYSNSNGHDIFKLSGGATVTVASETWSLNLGASGTRGLVIVDGTLTTIDATVSTSPVQIGGVTITPSSMNFGYSNVNSHQKFTLTGGASLNEGAVTMKVNFGGNGTTGIVIDNGSLTGFKASITGSFYLGGVNIVANGLTVDYSSDQNGTYAIYGAASMSGIGFPTIGVQLGTDAQHPGIQIQGGTLENFDASITSSFQLGGVSIETRQLTVVYSDPDQTYSIYGGTSISGIGFPSIAIQLGTASGGTDAAHPGISIKKGTLTAFDASVTSDFSLGGVQIHTRGLGVDYTPVSGTYAIFGGASMSGIGVPSISIQLGEDVQHAGLLIQNGTLQSFNASVTAGFTMLGLELAVQQLTVVYAAPTPTHGSFFEIYGSASVSTNGDQLKGAALLGDAQTPGLVIEDGALLSFNIGVSGTINLGPTKFSADKLTVAYVTSSGLLQITGGATLTLSAGIQGGINLPAGGITVDTKTGDVHVNGLEVFLTAKFGNYGLKNLDVKYTDIGGVISVSASGAVDLPGGIEVGGSLAFSNGQLTEIGLSYDGTPGIAVGDSGLFITHLAGQIDHLDDVNNLVVTASVGVTYGESVQISGHSYAVFDATGMLTVTKTTLVIDGIANVLGGNLGTGTAKLILDYSLNEYSITVDAESKGGLEKFHGDLNFSDKNNTYEVWGSADFVYGQVPGLSSTYSIIHVSGNLEINSKHLAISGTEDLLGDLLGKGSGSLDVDFETGTLTVVFNDELDLGVLRQDLYGTLTISSNGNITGKAGYQLTVPQSAIVPSEYTIVNVASSSSDNNLSIDKDGLSLSGSRLFTWSNGTPKLSLDQALPNNAGRLKADLSILQSGFTGQAEIILGNNGTNPAAIDVQGSISIDKSGLDLQGSANLFGMTLASADVNLNFATGTYTVTFPDGALTGSLALTTAGGNWSFVGDVHFNVNVDTVIIVPDLGAFHLYEGVDSYLHFDLNSSHPSLTLGGTFTFGNQSFQLAEFPLSRAPSSLNQLFSDLLDQVRNQAPGLIQSWYTSSISQLRGYLDAAGSGLITGSINLGNVLKSQFQTFGSDLTNFLLSANQPLSAIANIANSVYGTAYGDIASALKTVGYDAREVGAALSSGCGLSAKQAAAALQYANYGVTEIAGTLENAYGLAGSATGNILHELNYGLTNIANALQSAYGFGQFATAQVLGHFPLGSFGGDTDLAKALQVSYQLTLQQEALVLTSLFDGASFLADGVASDLKRVFNPDIQSLATALGVSGFNAQDAFDALIQEYGSQTPAVMNRLLSDATYSANQIKGVFLNSSQDFKDYANETYNNAVGTVAGWANTFRGWIGF